jgi:tetratricopeptide (TPR) repeat protein
MYVLDNGQNVKEYLTNSQIAFSSKQFEESLEWVQKALEVDGDDVEANSQAGVVSVVLKRFDDALKYFRKAVDLNPNSGDSLFNLGNAYFFMKDYNHALKYYSMADTAGCSENARAKLYYQMAVICSATGNVRSALVNYQKYEDCDASNGLDPNVITEKVKLYLACDDIDNAISCANQLVLVAPRDSKGYEIYFKALLLGKSYDRAEKVLDEAIQYAELDQSKRLTLDLDRVALYTARAEQEPQLAETYYLKALEVLEGVEGSQGLEKSQLDGARLTAADVYVKLGRFDEAIDCVHRVRGLDECEVPPTDGGAVQDYGTVDVDGLADIIDEKVYSGEIDSYALENADVEYDENGYERKRFAEGAFGSVSVDGSASEASSGQERERSDLPSGQNDRCTFVLLSCYAEKEDYQKALYYARVLKGNSNPYYAYYGTYVEAFSMKQLSLEGWESVYDGAIDFFRTRMMRVRSDRLAVVFRARLYAERGKFAKALEMVKLLPDGTKESVLEYVEKYRKEHQYA